MRVTDSQVRIAQILWLALALSLVIYAAIVWFVSRAWPPPPPLSQIQNDPLVLVLFGAALLDFVLGWIVPSMKLQSATSVDDVRAALVIRWALFESVAIFGLVAAFVRQNADLFVPAALLSVAGFILSFPSRYRLEAYSVARSP